MDIISSAKKRARSIWDAQPTVFDAAPQPATVFADAPKNDAIGPKAMLIDGSSMILPTRSQMEAHLGQKITQQEYEQRLHMETTRANEQIAASAKPSPVDVAAHVGNGMQAASGVGIASDSAPLPAMIASAPSVQATKKKPPEVMQLYTTPDSGAPTIEDSAKGAAIMDVGRGGPAKAAPVQTPPSPALQKSAPALQKVYKWTPKGLVEEFVTMGKHAGGAMLTSPGAGATGDEMVGDANGVRLPGKFVEESNVFRKGAPPKWKVEEIEGRPLTAAEYHAWLSRGMY